AVAAKPQSILPALLWRIRLQVGRRASKEATTAARGPRKNAAIAHWVGSPNLASPSVTANQLASSMVLAASLSRRGREGRRSLTPMAHASAGNEKAQLMRLRIQRAPNLPEHSDCPSRPQHGADQGPSHGATLSWARTSRVDDRPLRVDAGSGRKSSRFQPTAPHDVQDRRAAREQVVGDEPAMAPPPDRLGAHEGAAFTATCLDQVFQSLRKGL